MSDPSPRLRGSIRLLVGFACGIALALAGSAPAQANQGVDAGFDYFQSLPGTEVDLSVLGLGIVPLEGVPMLPDELGGTDTIVRRNDPVPLGGGTIDIELIALSLKSVDPVDLTPLGGPFIGVFADLYTTVNVGGQVPGLPVYSPLLPSSGRMEIQHPFPEGGLFDSCFGDPADAGTCGFLGVPGGGVYADAIFVVPGGDPNNPLDVILNTPAPRISLFTAGSRWAHNGQPPVGAGCPRGGPFAVQPCSWKITAILENGPHPVRPVLFPVNHYKVYQVDDVPVNISVELVDQFNRQCQLPPANAGNYCFVDADCDSALGSGDGVCVTTNVVSANLDFIDRVANPVNKLPELTITDPNEHQIWYHFSVASATPPGFTVSIDNQFGLQEWMVDNQADRWLVTPAQKTPHGPPVLEHHYMCYRAQGPVVPMPSRQLEDQFGLELVDVLEPRVFCNPVEKTVGPVTFPVPDPDDHLACYHIEPQVDHDVTRQFTDQFGVWLLNAHENLLLCLPSSKETPVPSHPPHVPGLGKWGAAALGTILLMLTLLWFARGWMSAASRV
jgi:hypothetical protein